MGNPFDCVLPPRQRAQRLAGRMLGSYRLEQKLSEGEGGFGIVYRGTHAERAMGPAAVKVFTRELGDDPLARAAFEREVTILRELSEKAASHRLVKIRDSGISEDGLPWRQGSLVVAPARLPVSW